jgi:hypothetical protein
LPRIIPQKFHENSMQSLHNLHVVGPARKVYSTTSAPAVGQARPLHASDRLPHQEALGAVTGRQRGGGALAGKVRDMLFGQADPFNTRQSSELMKGDHGMKMRLLTQIPGMTLAVLLTLVVAQGLVFGHSVSRVPPRPQPRRS